MKKTLCVGFLLAVFLLTLSGCDKSRENSFEGKETTQESFATEATEHSGNPTTGETTGEEQGGADWSGITENGVDEDIVFQNLDIGVLEEIAEKLQNRVKEAEVAEAEDPAFTLEGKWYPFMFDSNAYKEVVALGERRCCPFFGFSIKVPMPVCTNTPVLLPWRNCRRFILRMKPLFPIGRIPGTSWNNL